MTAVFGSCTTDTAYAPLPDAVPVVSGILLNPFEGHLTVWRVLFPLTHRLIITG